MGTQSLFDREIQINTEIDFELNEVSVKETDLFFTDAIRTLRNAERLRRDFACKWNSLLIKSGAISVKRPNLNSIINGILWKIAVDIKIKLKSTFDFEIISPYLVFNEEKYIPSNELKDLSAAFRDFIDWYWEHLDVIEHVHYDSSVCYERSKDKKLKNVFLTGLKSKDKDKR